MQPSKKEGLLSRYEKSPTGDIIIDVSTPKIENLYDNFDKLAPYVKKT